MPKKLKRNKINVSVYLKFKREFDNKKDSQQEIYNWDIKNQNSKTK